MTDSCKIFHCTFQLSPTDKRGRIHNKAEQMLQALLRCLEEHHTKFVLALGDQMYSDRPLPFLCLIPLILPGWPCQVGKNF
jgi:hypothetical protein